MNDWSFVSVDMELTNICNNNCLMCPHDKIKRPQGVMTFDTFNKIIDIIAQNENLITLSGMGDPLLHPGVFKMICLMKERNCDVGIVINPSTLSPNLIKSLLNAKPNLISISFPSTRKPVFEKLCPNITFDQALQITKDLIEQAKGRVGIKVSGIVTIQRV